MESRWGQELIETRSGEEGYTVEKRSPKRIHLTTARKSAQAKGSRKRHPWKREKGGNLH
jgi:hypothetical protein